MAQLVGLAVLIAGLVAPVSNGEKLLKEAKVSLADSLDKAGKLLKDALKDDMKNVTPVSAWLRDVKGKVVYTVRYAKGQEQIRLTLDAKTGELIEKVTEKRSRAKALELSKTSLNKAVEIALEKVPGKAYRAGLVLDEKKAVYEIVILGDGGKRSEIDINAATGKIIEVEQDDDDDEDEDDDDDDEDEDGEDDDGEDDDKSKKKEG